MQQEGEGRLSSLWDLVILKHLSIYLALGLSALGFVFLSTRSEDKGRGNQVKGQILHRVEETHCTSVFNAETQMTAPMSWVTLDGYLLVMIAGRLFWRV